MSEILFSYVAVVLIAVSGLVAGVFGIRKWIKYSFKLGAFSIGIMTSLVGYLGIFLLFKMLFYSGDYYNTVTFRTIVGLLILSLFSFLRFVLVRGICFNRYREEAGVSFSFGFGMAPLALFGFYALIIFFVLLVNVVFNAPYTIGEDGLTFADNTMISVYVPAVGQVFYALAFVFYAVIVVSSSLLIDRTMKQRYHIAVFLIWSILFFILEGAAILPIPFSNIYGLVPWQLSLTVGVIAVLAVLLLVLMPAQKEKKSTYTKQFE